MLNPEQIEKLIEIAKPDGFGYKAKAHYCKDLIVVPEDTECGLGFLEQKKWLKTYYPLFLQKCIEGINKNNNTYEIDQSCNFIQVLTGYNKIGALTVERFNITDRPDQAKEQALFHILEHIK